MKDNIKKDIPLEHLTDEQLDDFLNYTEPFTEENFKNILQRFTEERDNTIEVTTNKTKSRNKKFWFFLAAAASFFFLAAFTQMSQLKTIYYQLFGSHAEKILANSDQLSDSVTDQGLQLKALASFRDTNSTYFLAELTDLTEDRLSADTTIDSWQMNGGGNARVIDYNTETKTATIAVYAIDNFDGSENDYGFILNAFSSGKIEKNEAVVFDLSHYLNSDATWTTDAGSATFGGGHIPELEKKYGMTLEELGADILLPEEKSAVISEDQQVSLSNIDYKDDLLHLQVKLPNTPETVYTFISLVNKQTGEEVQPIASFGVDYGTHNNETGRDDYEQNVFDLSKSELSEYDLKIESMSYQTYQTGEWAIKLAEPQKLPTISLADTEIKIANEKVNLQDISLTALSLAFTIDHQETDEDMEETPLEILVRLKDGQEIPYTDEETFNVSANHLEKEELQIYGKYLTLEDVESLIINGTEIKLAAE